ncbi:MAG: DUF3465 domain-containing protein, partial [Rhodanobacter sp.]
MKKLAALVAAVAFALVAHHHYVATPVNARADRAVVETPVAESRPGEVSGTGTVIRVLPDDTEGSRHQRFILRLASGQTLLVAHNIDLAPRVSPLSVGDTVEYQGEYVWNEKGGVVHWTHHDPSGNHLAGWLKHNGQTFQ